jgi:hypothetical protein
MLQVLKERKEKEERKRGTGMKWVKDGRELRKEKNKGGKVIEGRGGRRKEGERKIR